MIQAPPVGQEYHAHGAPIAIPIQDLHRDSIAEDQPRYELFGTLAEPLAVLKRGNTIETYSLRLAAV